MRYLLALFLILITSGAAYADGSEDKPLKEEWLTCASNAGV